MNSRYIIWSGNDRLAGAAAPVESALNPNRMPIEVLSVEGSGGSIELAVNTRDNGSSQQTPN